MNFHAGLVFLFAKFYNNIEAEEQTLTFRALFAVLALQATNAEVRIAKGHST